MVIVIHSIKYPSTYNIRYARSSPILIEKVNFCSDFTSTNIKMSHGQEELIMPKKLANPVKESPTRKELHRELLFNQKIGKNVLNQKSELQRVMEKKGFNLKSTSGGADSGITGSQDGAKQLHGPNEFIHVHRKITAHGNSETSK